MRGTLPAGPYGSYVRKESRWKSEQVAKHSRNCILAFTKLSYRPDSLVLSPRGEENFRKPEGRMKRCIIALACACILMFFAGCKSGPTPSPLGVQVNVSGSFKFEEVGGAPVTLTATVTGDAANQGVTWALSQANVGCAPACGTLKPSGLSAVYTPPTSLPGNQQATITARSNKDNRQDFAFNFQITGAVTVSIAPKFSSQTEGGPATNLSATVNNDPTNSGVTWTFTVGGSTLTCSNAASNPCAGTGGGTLTPGPAPGLTAQYQPPNTAVPSGDTQPTITATSNADTTKSDNFSFTLAPPPISVSITNKFSSTAAGGSAVSVNVVVTNDQFYSNAGATWTLTSTVNGVTGPCTPTCGTLKPSVSPSLSASYSPPATAPASTDPNASPTITATSVSDTTKSDNFTFNILSPASVFKGGYVFQLRGFDASGAPMATAGVLTSDGSGNITGAELDINDKFVTTPYSGLSGTYTIDTTSFNGVPRVTVCIALASNACSTVGGPGTVVLKGAVSSDGTRARIIEYDSSLALLAGSMLKQDPTALSGTSVAGNYAFELDSDAGTSTLSGVTTTGRIVEAGQLVIGAGATSITGGIADAAQAQQTTFLAGGVSPATIAGAATAPDALGRGTFTLSVSNSSGNPYITNYAYYVVNAQQLDLLEVDTGGSLMTLQSGTAQRQNTLTANSINATSVVALTGAAPLSGVPSTAVIVGVMSITGGTSVSLNYESNYAGGNTSQNPSVVTGSVYQGLFDTATGRALLQNTFFASAAVYLYDTGKGFLIDITSGSPSSHAFSGPLIPQAAGPFSASDIGGNYIGVAGGSSIAGIPNLDFAANFDATAQTYSDEVDFTSNSTIGPSGNGQVQNFPFSNYQWVLVDTAAGRGEVSFPPTVFGDFTSTTGQPTFASFYLIGPRQFVAIGQGSDGTGGEPSGVLFFDPQ